MLHWNNFNHISPYLYQICLYLTNISPIYYKNQSRISYIWIWEKSENPDPPPSSQSSPQLALWTFWFSVLPPPPLWAFSTFYDICFLYCSPKQNWSLTLKTQVLLLNMFRYIQEYWRQIPALPQAYLKHTFWIFWDISKAYLKKT